jgi:TolB-like protein/DNA-binding winged helix-turn-helix (wHTH) protein/Flp pilus assembly protein TadD
MPICFGEFELHPDSWELRRLGRPVKLEHIPMELLLMLLEQPGTLVHREAINRKLWGDDVFIETEHSINTAMNKLRFILRDDPKRPRYIRTVIGQGYCFIGEVHKKASAPPVAGSQANAAAAEPALEGEAVKSLLATSHAPPPPQPTTTGSPWKAAAIGVLATMLCAIGVFAYQSHLRKSHEQTTEQTTTFRSVAVLPFRNLAQNADQDYLVDAMTDQVITDLARSTSHRVISRRSAMHFKNTQISIQEIAQTLGIDTIVEGSYIRSGNRIRITAQLLDARTDRHLWAQTYEESDEDLLVMQDLVASDIAHQVSLSLGDRLSVSKVRPIVPRAHDAYLRGRYLWNARTLEELQASIHEYTLAIREDSTYAEAFAALAESYVIRSTYDPADPSDALLKARYAAERALQLDPSLGEAHTATAAILTASDWNWAGAEREFQRAIQLSPGDSRVHHWYSLHLARLGRMPQAELEMQRALVLDPLSPIITTDWAETAYWAHKPAEAMKRIDSALADNPSFADAHLVKAKILLQQSSYAAALTEIQTASQLFNGGLNLDFLRAYALAQAGQKNEAQKIANTLQARAKQHYIADSNLAALDCGLGHLDDAIDALDRAFAQHDQGLNMLRIDPLFDACRAHPRFNKLLRTLNLVD